MNEEERIKEIKTLRDAAIERRDPWYVSTGVYISDVTYLLAQLSESQRREKAAVECDEMLEDAVRQWCDFLDESPERKDGVGFAGFAREVYKSHADN